MNTLILQLVAAWKKQILFQKVLSVRQIWAKIHFTIIEKKKLKFGNLLDPSLKKKSPGHNHDPNRESQRGCIKNGN